LYRNGLSASGAYYAPSGTTPNNSAAQAAIGAVTPKSSVAYDLGLRHVF